MTDYKWFDSKDLETPLSSSSPYTLLYLLINKTTAKSGKQEYESTYGNNKKIIL